MKYDPLHHVVRGVSNRNHLRARLHSSPLEELITKRARAGLHGSMRHRTVPALDDQLDSESVAQVTHMLRDERGSFLERVVVVGGDDLVTGFDQREKERGAVGAAGNGREHAMAR